jgi:hypothetical protein
MNMKKILAAVGIAGSVFAGLMGSGIGVVHATTQSFIDCLNAAHVNINNYGHDAAWWVGLSRAINIDLDRGALPSDIVNTVQQKGHMSRQDAEGTVSCAFYNPA